MKTKLAIIGLLLATGLFALAQTNSVIDPFANPTDKRIRDWFEGFSAYQMFLIPAVTVFIMAFRRFVSFVPDQLWPWIAPFIGAGLDFVAVKVGLWTGSPETGLLMGGLAVWFSQVGKQTKEIALQGLSVTPSGVSNQKTTSPKSSA